MFRLNESHAVILNATLKAAICLTSTATIPVITQPNNQPLSSNEPFEIHKSQCLSYMNTATITRSHTLHILLLKHFISRTTAPPQQLISVTTHLLF